MPSKIRLQRIADRFRKELSEMLIRDIADPRLSGVTVTDAKVDRELTFADFYVSAIEGKEREPEIMEAFQHARGFIRSTIADRVDLRVYPQLRFHWDPTPERADKIDRLIHSLSETQEDNHQE